MLKADTFGCVNNTIKTFTGRYFDLRNPRSSMVHSVDLAHALALTNRFGGQSPYPYSVAQHSVWCYRVAIKLKLDDGIQLACLLHDATEAYVGDVVKPLKIMLSDFDQIEDGVEKAIMEWAGGTESAWKADIVTTIDRAALLAERDFLWPRNDGMKWPGEDSPEITCIPRPRIRRMSWSRAKHDFLQSLSYFGLTTRLQVIFK